MQQQRHLGGYIRAISNAMAQQMQQNCEAQGLTSTQSMFLHHLWVRRTRWGLETCAKDLEQFFDVKHSTVSGILQRMEAAGYVTFQSSTADHRCKTIRLTEKALAQQAETEKRIQETEQLLVCGMTPEEAAEFRRLLALAANNLGVCCPRPVKEDIHP